MIHRRFPFYRSLLVDSPSLELGQMKPQLNAIKCSVASINGRLQMSASLIKFHGCLITARDLSPSVIRNSASPNKRKHIAVTIHYHLYTQSTACIYLRPDIEIRIHIERALDPLNRVSLSPHTFIYA